ncbi:hypothetical protein VTJ04DRAFT_3684 [Mycothermus thermophilus]|uniref:uncharacterized protein n=1 Tax=Humicola insolens TaxID=85995 RepID=UPI003741FDFD
MACCLLYNSFSFSFLYILQGGGDQVGMWYILDSSGRHWMGWMDWVCGSRESPAVFLDWTCRVSFSCFLFSLLLLVQGIISWSPRFLYTGLRIMHNAEFWVQVRVLLWGTGIYRAWVYHGFCFLGNMDMEKQWNGD